MNEKTNENSNTHKNQMGVKKREAVKGKSPQDPFKCKTHKFFLFSFFLNSLFCGRGEGGRVYVIS